VVRLGPVRLHRHGVIVRTAIADGHQSRIGRRGRGAASVETLIVVTVSTYIEEAVASFKNHNSFTLKTSRADLVLVSPNQR
jgi:hypothetical protein